MKTLTYQLLSQKLIDLIISGEVTRTSVAGANLFRIITTSKEKDLIKEDLAALLQVLATTQVHPMRSTLCAVFWNLSVSGLVLFSHYLFVSPQPINMQRSRHYKYHCQAVTIS
mgnify:CR=1 FL=1